MPVGAEIVPLLLILPMKVEIVTEPLPLAPPPTRIPAAAAAIEPELVMPPEKVEIVTVSLLVT